ncbi:uncharacterized protein LOC123269213 [Cotesia glomerata]|uniref:uncharacterized protein LOC123269213 n=1 Tax=Cotesia glomerata TaxID=32391 RepID=UPI001D005B18|nr:uncharacterized protein LOC123269213 [Cotesia glomerata]
MNKCKGDVKYPLDLLKKKLKKYQDFIDSSELSDDPDEVLVDPGSDDSLDDDHSQSVLTSDSDSSSEVIKNVTKASKQSHETTEAEAPHLSDAVRKLLGTDKRATKDKTFNFHPELVGCWKDVLKSGLDKEAKLRMIDIVPNKGNCPLSAPVFNPELIPLLHTTARSRDKYLSNDQDMCGRSLVALGMAICSIFNDDSEPVDKDELL